MAQLKLKKLFDPIRVGNVQLKNRIMMAALLTPSVSGNFRRRTEVLFSRLLSLKERPCFSRLTI